MFVDIVPNRSSPPAILLRESFRENGKTKKRTIANLTGLVSVEEARKIKQVLKGSDIATTSVKDTIEISSTRAHGHVAAVLGTIKALKLPGILGKFDCPERRHALALIAGRIISPGSKLALSRELTGGSSTLGEELELSAELTETDLYEGMRWLLDRQGDIEKRLAKKHLSEGSVTLYDLSSSYYEGSSCPLAKRGHNRDLKKGKKQINYGVLTNKEGCPVAIEVYPGNTADPNTVADQLKKLRTRFKIKKAIVVGDRGMLTNVQLDLGQAHPGLAEYGWISALKNIQIKTLVNAGDIQPDLFDECGLAEITSEKHFPGERLVVCRNPRLAKERTRKRNELLDETEKVLLSIQKACQRANHPYRGKDKIASRVEREAGKYKMLKHFDLTIEEDSLAYQRNEKRINSEQSLDGFYVIRSRNVDREEMSDKELVETYKMLAEVEKVFRRMKTTSLQVRPIFHRLEEMVKAHLLICMLAYHVQWHMEKSLAPILFRDEELAAQKEKRDNPVEPTEPSESVKAKKADKVTDDKLPVHSFRTLLKDLAGIARVKCRSTVTGEAEFTKYPDMSPVQKKAFDLLGIKVCP